MAISNTKTRDKYTLDAVTTQFDITFDAVLDDNGNAKELAVLLIENGTVTKLVKNTDYTVSALKVNYSDATSHAGSELLISRETPLTQLMDFVNNGAYTLQQIEDMADKLTRIVQEHDTRIDDTKTATEEAQDAEAWAVGQRDGEDVPATDPTYQNNSKYYAEYVAGTVAAHSTSLDYLDNYSANVDTVAGDKANIDTVAGISSDVTEVAGISTDVTTVAGSISDVSNVATNMSDINDIADKLEDILLSDDYASLSRQYSEGKKLDGTDVTSGEVGYRNNAKYYADLAGQIATGGLRYVGTWDVTGATDYSGISLPRALGDVFYVTGISATIDGVTYSQGDLIIFNQAITTGTITTALIDKIDNTESITPDNVATLTNKTISFSGNTLTGVASTDTAQALKNKTIDYDKNTLVHVAAKSLLPTYERAFYATKLFGSNKTTVTIYEGLEVEIGGTIYTTESDKTITIADHVSVANRTGKDVYIYACVPASGNEPDIVLSLNASAPTGYDTTNSRKIGGFHCLCANVGTISGHDLSGYVAGDVLPSTRWDLFFRPNCDPEGMAYEPKSGVWLDIYLASWNGTKLVSVNGGTIADGASTKKFHGELFSEEFKNVGKRLMWRHEFVIGARGSNEGTNIYGSADPGTTGGHVDTNSRRIISNIGLEDCCGVMCQWTEDLGFAGGSAWGDSVYDASVDGTKRGQSYGTLYRLPVGAGWADGAICGSRSADCSLASACVSSGYGGRGACEPRVRISADYLN